MTTSTDEVVDESALDEMLEIAKKDSSKVVEVLYHISGLSGTNEGIALLLKTFDKVLPILVANYQLPSSTRNITQIKLHICSALSNLMASEHGVKAKSLSTFFATLSKESIMKRAMKDALKEPEEDQKLLRLRTVVLLGNSTALSTEVCSSILAFANKQSNQHLNILERMYAFSLDVSELGTAFLAVVSNLTQLGEFRNWMLSPKKASLSNEIRLKALLPYATFSPCARRRESVLAALKNCCFSTEHHEKLVDSAVVSIFPALLLPLADGSTKLTDEENSQLVVELRYLDASKQRESSAVIRMLCVEALYQLCATKTGREALRNAGAYLILREYHRWEEEFGKNAAINARLFDVIEIIISDEHGDNKFEDYHKVEIPEDLKAKFQSEHENKQN